MKRKIDLDWYEEKAMQLLNSKQTFKDDNSLSGIEPKYRRPFQYFYELISTTLKVGSNVLEIGAGTGDHTKIILDAKVSLTALDISTKSLEVLRLRFPTVTRTVIGDMQHMPFDDGEFDSIISCGSLSYGNPEKVYLEIYRVLKPGGNLIILDTLANNPFYALARLRHILMLKRSLSTLLYMPSTKHIRQLGSLFQFSTVRFFDPLIAFIPRSKPKYRSSLLFSRVISQANLKLEQSAFSFFSHKFVMFANKQVEAKGASEKDSFS